MACDCINDIQNKLRESLGDPEASIDVGFLLNRRTNQMMLVPAGLVLKTRRTKKDGTLMSGKTTVPLTPSFCPFCGTRYEDTKPAPRQPTSEESAKREAAAFRGRRRAVMVYLADNKVHLTPDQIDHLRILRSQAKVQADLDQIQSICTDYLRLNAEAKKATEGGKIE